MKVRAITTWRRPNTAKGMTLTSSHEGALQCRNARQRRRQLDDRCSFPGNRGGDRGRIARILAVEMEAAALYAFAKARGKSVFASPM